MSQKRLLEDSLSQSAARELRRRLSPLPFGRGVTDTELQRPSNLEFLVQGLEPRLRHLVREGVNEGLQRFLQPDPRPPIQINVQHPFKLHFNHRLPQTLYTGDWIRSEGGEIVQVVLLNAMTRDIIKTGRLSCMTMKIIVLDGSFDGDEEGSWTTQQFHSSEVGPREGKGLLLKGELKIKLQDGIAYLKDVAFTDNSHWRRTGKFKLGASLNRNRQAEGVREAISEAFAVKDRRGKASQKPKSPASSDEVWRLKGIAKDGKFHRCLTDAGVETVLQFRRLLDNDPDGLRGILGFKKCDNRWKQIVEHAPVSPEVLIARPGNVVSSAVLMPQLQTSFTRSQEINCQWTPGEHEAQSSGQNQSSLANFTAKCWQPNDSPVMNQLHLIEPTCSGSTMNASFEALPDVIETLDPALLFVTTQENPEPLIPQGADLNFVQPAATFNEYVGGASGSNYFGSADDPLQSQLNVTAAMPSKSFNTMNYIHGCQAECGCKPSTSEFAENHPSPADEYAFCASVLVCSPDVKGKPIKTRWLRVGAVLKWTIKKKVSKKKR